jgi:hypothetical protein
LWLQNEELPEQLQPKQCKAVLGCTADGQHVVVYQSPEHSQVYLQNSYLRNFITVMLSRGIDVFIVTGNERKMLPAKRTTQLVDITTHLAHE